MDEIDTWLVEGMCPRRMRVTAKRERVLFSLPYVLHYQDRPKRKRIVYLTRGSTHSNIHTYIPTVTSVVVTTNSPVGQVPHAFEER